MSTIFLSPASVSTTACADRIRAAYGRTVDAVLDVGRELIAAKKSLPHGQFTAMVERDLPFQARAAQMYMRAADHPILSNPKWIALLPPSISKLDRLARLPPQELEAALARCWALRAGTPPRAALVLPPRPARSR